MPGQRIKNYGRRLAILGTRGIPVKDEGFETFAEELATRLVKRGIEVTVYCEKNGAACPSTYKDVKLEYVPAPKLGPLTTLLFDLRCLWRARKDFDIVYMLGYGASIFCFLPRLWGSIVWINMDGIEWARSKWGRAAKLWFKMMEAAAMWTANRLIADARGILTHLESRHHMHMPPASVIPYGAPVLETAPDQNAIAEWQLAPGNYYLMVCRLEPENSVQEIVMGFLQSDTRHTLVVVGNIEPATEYVKEILKMNDGRVRFIGPVYDKRKLQALRYHAFAYFHGHTVGGTNPSLLEAMGSGNCIIAHNNIFNREVANGAALYFDRENDIAKNIGILESYSTEQRTLMQSAAKERIRKIYNWDAIVATYAGFINSYFRIQERANIQWRDLYARNSREKKTSKTPPRPVIPTRAEIATSNAKTRVEAA